MQVHSFILIFTWQASINLSLKMGKCVSCRNVDHCTRQAWTFTLNITRIWLELHSTIWFSFSLQKLIFKNTNVLLLSYLRGYILCKVGRKASVQNKALLCKDLVSYMNYSKFPLDVIAHIRLCV